MQGARGYHLSRSQEKRPGVTTYRSQGRRPGVTTFDVRPLHRQPSVSTRHRGDTCGSGAESLESARGALDGQVIRSSAASIRDGPWGFAIVHRNVGIGVAGRASTAAALTLASAPDPAPSGLKAPSWRRPGAGCHGVNASEPLPRTGGDLPARKYNPSRQRPQASRSARSRHSVPSVTPSGDWRSCAGTVGGNA